MFRNTDAMDLELITIKSINLALIEFTSNCNLRCVYCAKSQPGYMDRTRNLEKGIINEVVNSLLKLNVKKICVNGHGETTILKGWNSYCEKLLKYNIPLSIITNFSKKFSDDEIDVLSRFTTIEVSCDTANPDLFAKLRRGARLEQLIENMRRVREKALLEKRPGPGFSWSCVVTDATVMGLPGLVRLASKCGVRNISFCNFSKLPDVEGILNVNHVTEMPPKQLIRAAKSIVTAAFMAEESGIHLGGATEFCNTIIEKIEVINSDNPGRRNTESGDIQEKGKSRYTSEQPAGYTRNCLDAWQMLYIHADHGINSCCAQPNLSYLKPGGDLMEKINSEPFLRLRKNLLSGDLDEHCLSCPTYSWIPLDQLQGNVSRYLGVDQGIKSSLLGSTA